MSTSGNRQPRHRDRAVTSIVDLTRDEHGQVHARLLDVTLGRSGPVYASWLRAQTREFVDGITHAALDPFRGYANAIRTELPTTRSPFWSLPRRQARLHRYG